MNDISEILRELLDRYEDEYVQWCEDNGYSVKDGYLDFINEIVESQDSFWDNYNEFGNNI